MSKSSDYGELDALTISDCSQYRWRDRQGDGRRGLHGSQEFARLEYTIKGKRLSRIGQPLHYLIPKRRCYAYQPI